MHVCVCVRAYVCVFTDAIDQMWMAQQRHLECLQDPPGMPMYRVARTTKFNTVDVPFYKGLRGSNSLEGFHKFLPNMIPGTTCVVCILNYILCLVTNQNMSFF